MSLGEKLANLRKNAKLTQAELGEKLNISAQAISKWENNTSEPDIATLKKLADIYGIKVADIIEPENKASHEESEKEEKSKLYEGLYDIYLTEYPKDQKIMTIKLLTDIFGFGVAQAKNISENLPHVLAGRYTEEECKTIEEKLEEVGAKCTRMSCVGEYDKLPLFPVKPSLYPIDRGLMKKRFITANITAGIPGLAVMIAIFFASGGFADVLLAIYLGIATYTGIFLAWYPTFTRGLFLPFSVCIDNMRGIFSFIIYLIPFALSIIWVVIVILISPINYAFAIKKRVIRMKQGNTEDDIFLQVAVMEAFRQN